MDKSVITFLLGAGLASGIFYVGTRKPAPATVTRMADGKPAPIIIPETALPQEGGTVSPLPVPAPAPAVDRPAQSPVTAVEDVPVSTPRSREMVATVSKKPKAPPATIARATPAPVAASAPSPVQAPVQVQAPPPTRQQEAPAARPAVVASIPRVEDAPVPPPAPPKRVPNTVTIPAGTSLAIRLGQTLSTERSKPGDSVIASLDQPLVVNGFVLAERGARVQGRVVEADPGGRVQGLAELKLELTQLNTSDGQRVRIATEPFARQAQETHKEDAAKIGGGAALGAIIGAIAGGGKGAAIGAGVGGAGGTGVVMGTRGKQVTLPVESRMTFRLRNPVTLTERLD